MKRFSNTSLKRFQTTFLAPVAVLAGGLFLVSNASASIMGTLNTGSSGTVTVNLTSVLFNPDSAAVGGGNSDVASSTALSFVGCASGVLGSPGCLSLQEGITVNSPVSAASIGENNFLTFAAHPLLDYSLLSIGPGSANTNCAAANSNGASCSVFAGSPIILTFENGGTSVSLSVSGKASDAGIGGLAAGSNFVGSFTDPLNGTIVTSLGTTIAATPQAIQQFFCPAGVCANDGRSITGSQSGNFFASAVPEPSPVFLSSIGILMLLVGIGFRKSHRNRA
jgi:hypothetical protein